MVPPPIVPTSIHGIVQLIYKSSWLTPVTSITVIHWELQTF